MSTVQMDFRTQGRVTILDGPGNQSIDLTKEQAITVAKAILIKFGWKLNDPATTG